MVALCVAIPQTMIQNMRDRTLREAFSIDVERLPLELGEWSGTEAEMDDRIIRKIGAASTVSRSYRHASGREAWVHLAAFPNIQPDTPHHPQECYSGAEWTLLDDQWVGHPPNDGYRLMSAVQEGSQIYVVYWFQLGSQVAGTHPEIRRILQQLRRQGEPFPSTVKVLIQVSVELAEAEAKATASDLAAMVYDWVAKNSQRQPAPET
jgi:hypothetical protein